MAAITHAHTGVMPNRPHDYIYDSTFTVSSHKDHVKQMTRSQAQQVIINPTFDNMFSALRHFPPMQYRLKINPFPSGIGQDRRTLVVSDAVSGQNRFKYFKRPIMPYQPVFSGQIIYARQADALSQQAAAAKDALEHGANLAKLTKTTASQTMYRISETQTDPYSPDYVFKPNEPPPELLALSTLSYGQGLPAGIAELEMIERARIKRVWEASLPIVTDQASFERRLKMMEEMELKEWEEREIEIKRLQEARLAVLEAVIRQREKENDQDNDKRVERIWQRKMQEREAVFEKINRKRIKALRKLADQRTRIDNKVEKRDIIGEYGNYASKVYAPKARDGVFRDKADTTLHVRLEELTHYAGLQELEATLPPSVTQIKIDESIKLSKTNEKTPEARRERALKEQLERMNMKLVERKERQNQVKPPLKYAVKIEKPAVRPPTPTIRVPGDEEEEMETAAYLLQNLIRGRAVQQDMYKQKERRLDLINELRARHLLKKVASEETILVPTGKPLSESKDKGTTAILTKPLTDRQIVFESAIQAEQVGKSLDFLTKQLVRLREERRIAAMVKLAERTRRMREAQESGLRQHQLLQQNQHDAIFKQVMGVHHETVETYLDSIMGDTVQETAEMLAQECAEDYFIDMLGLHAAQQDQEAAESPHEHQTSTEARQYSMVSDLITSFLIPYVEHSVTRGLVESQQHQFLMAAHQSLFLKLPSIEKQVASSSSPSSSLQDPGSLKADDHAGLMQRASVVVASSSNPAAAASAAPAKSRSTAYAEKFGVAVLPPLPTKDPSAPGS